MEIVSLNNDPEMTNKFRAEKKTSNGYSKTEVIFNLIRSYFITEHAC